MSKIRIIPFGGQDERGKNCFVIEIDEDIFIFDIGFKLPESSILGVDIIIPNYEYLYNNIKNVKGIFVSNPSAYNSGGLQYFIRKTKVPIYCNELSSTVFKHKNSKIRLEHRNSSITVIRDKETIDFGKIKIEAFKTTASSPNSLNFAVHTKDGTVVILNDFIFDGEEKDFFATDLQNISKIAKNNIIALLIDSEYASRTGFTSPNHKIDRYISNSIKEKKKRNIFAIFEEDIFNMNEIIRQAIEAERKVCVYGNLLNQIIGIESVRNAFKLKKEHLIPVEEFHKHEDAILLIAATGDVLYAKLAKIALGNDENVQLDEDDIVILATPPAPGVERRHADVLDELSRTNAKVISLSEKNLWSMRASFEDIKLAISMLRPKKIFPIKGLYKDFLGTRRAAVECGLKEEDVIILDNGDCAEIENGTTINTFKESKVIDDVFVDGIGVGDVSDVILYERKILGTDGVIVIGVNIDNITKLIVSLIDIQMRGIVYLQNDGVLFTKLQEIITENLEKHALEFKNNGGEYNLNLIKKELLSKLKTSIKKDTGKQPIILLVVNEVKEIKK